jgi:short-subunit dehydrogenase
MAQDLCSALITGASSGIGQALAVALATPGATLHLSGRDATRLEAVAESCRARGAVVHPRVIDVRDADTMAAWIGNAGRLDLVVANSGISAGTSDHAPDTPAQTRAIFATNLDGVLHTALPAMAVMQDQPADSDGVRGRIAAIASIAAFAPLPHGPAYSASKAAVDFWMVASAPAARARGIVLTSICPGYVRSGMTAGNRFAMPGLMNADRAADIILRGVAAGRVRVVFPWWIGLAARAAGLLPPRLLGALVAAQRGGSRSGQPAGEVEGR